MTKGCLITIEGGDGAGKSSQISMLQEWLTSQNITALTTREPGGTEGAEAIRTMVLTGKDEKWDDVTEALLFFAARRDHLQKLIWPTLDKGQWVISDRFVHSSYAYQGYGRGMEMDILKTLYKIVANGFKPDLTIVLDIDPEIGLARTGGRHGQAAKENRFEGVDLSFHQKLRNGFLEMASQDPEHFAVISAQQSIEDVHQDIIKTIQSRLLDKNRQDANTTRKSLSNGA